MASGELSGSGSGRDTERASLERDALLKRLSAVGWDSDGGTTLEDGDRTVEGTIRIERAPGDGLTLEEAVNRLRLTGEDNELLPGYDVGISETGGLYIGFKGPGSEYWRFIEGALDFGGELVSREQAMQAVPDLPAARRGIRNSPGAVIALANRGAKEQRLAARWHQKGHDDGSLPGGEAA